MPWSTRNDVDCRKEFIEKVLAGESVAEAARACGVSRQTGHKWLRRFNERGEDGLDSRSRAPESIPHKTAPELIERCLQVRRRYPTWGPKKIRGALLIEEPSIAWPAASTIGSWLDKAGMVERRRWRLRTPPSSQPLSHAKAPNDVWSVDFKGEFRLGDGSYCYPLTVTDNASRYILGIVGLPDTKGAGVAAAMRGLFETYGLPERIRSDNGSPFASRGPRGLSAVSVQWVVQGITHERIRPGQPQENGRHERMHLTLKQETTRPAADSLTPQQQRFDLFRTYFNTERPHEALNQQTPASAYQASAKRPDAVPAIEYDQADDVCYVYKNGGIRFRGTTFHIGEAFVDCPVGLKEVEEDLWMVHFASMPLGFIEKGDDKLTRYEGQ